MCVCVCVCVSIGLSVEWNSGVRVKGGQRHRISLLQVATNSAVLIVLLSQIRPFRLPKLLRQVLEDTSVRKVSNVCVCACVCVCARARAFEQTHPSDSSILYVGSTILKDVLFICVLRTAGGQRDTEGCGEAV